MRHDSGAAPTFVDLDGDGQLDMIATWKNGAVFTYRNESKTGMAAFAEGVRLQVGGKELKVSDGRPVIADWDQDGELDLIMGSDGQGIAWYPGSRENGKLTFGSGRDLVSVSNELGWMHRDPASRKSMILKDRVIGARPAPAVADWNNDGKLDLVVGDVTFVKTASRKLTPKEKAELKAIESDIQELGTKLGKLQEKAMAQATKDTGVNQNSEDQAALTKLYQALDGYLSKEPEYKKLNEAFMNLYRRQEKLVPSPQGVGFIWVFLRK